jgi:cobalt-zinc-cadmium efflux system outer membrane protein
MHTRQSKMRVFTTLLAILPVLFPGSLRAQESRDTTETPTQQISLRDYLAVVELGNPDLAAQRSTVSIAEAQRRVARLLPNPVTSLSYSSDRTGHQMPTTIGTGLTQTVLLGGKVSARSAVADHTYDATVEQYRDFGRTLRATAASAYVDAIVAELGAERRRLSSEAMEKLTAATQARFRAGDIGEVDFLQARVELLQFRGDQIAAEETRRAALLALSLLMGKQRTDTLFIPTPYQQIPPRHFALASLIDSALAQRPDVIAARRAADAAKAGIRLAKANRVSDIDVGVGYVRNEQSKNAIAPSQGWGALGVSLSFALPFSNVVNHGDFDVATYTFEQADRARISAEVRAENDVRQAHGYYELTVARLALYSDELLRDAERVAAARLYSYQRGSAPLTDVLIAQRALNDVYLAYDDALGEYLKAFIGLRAAIGSSNIDL